MEGRGDGSPVRSASGGAGPLDNPPTTSSSSSSAKEDPLADRFACPVKLTLRFPVYHRLTPQVRVTHTYSDQRKKAWPLTAVSSLVF